MKQYNFRKYCKKCGKTFTPITKSNYYCEKCKTENINLIHLKRLRGSLSNFIQRNIKRC